MTNSEIKDKIKEKLSLVLETSTLNHQSTKYSQDKEASETILNLVRAYNEYPNKGT